MVKLRPDRDIGGNNQKARRGCGLTQDAAVARLQLMGLEITRSTYAKIQVTTD